MSATDYDNDDRPSPTDEVREYDIVEPEEFVVALANGRTLRSAAEDYMAGDYVRVCNADGEEVAYWTSDEWVEDPVLVMGAILGAAAGNDPKPEPEPEPVDPNAPITWVVRTAVNSVTFEEWAVTAPPSATAADLLTAVNEDVATFLDHVGSEVVGGGDYRVSDYYALD